MVKKNMSLSPFPDDDDFPTGGGGGGNVPTNPPPNNPPVTTTTNGVTSMSIKPACDTDGFIKTFRGNSLCFDISGQIVIPEESERPPNSTLVLVNMNNGGDGRYHKSGGVDGQYDARMFEPALIDARQNAFITHVTSLTRPPSGKQTAFMGFFGEGLDRFSIQTYQVNDHYVATVFIPNSASHVAVYDPGANGLELSSPLRIWMNGNQVLFQHRRSFNWVTFYTASLGTGKYTAHWGTPSYNYPVNYPSIYKSGGTFQLDCLQVTTETTGGEFSGEGCRRCWQSPNQNGDFPIKFNYPEIDSIECTIRVEDLQIYSPACDDDTFAIVGTYVTVQHNGGSSARLVVSGGIAIDAYTWLLPVVEGRYSFKVVSGTNDDIFTETCFINVVRQLDVEGVDEGVYGNVAPGEIITFIANCEDAVFSSPTHPELLNGNVFKANGGDEDSFGSFKATIKVEGCGQVGYFTIEVMPLFPIPLFCGPKPKTIPVGKPDWNVTRAVTSGQNAEWILHSDTPKITWKGLSYVGLDYIVKNPNDEPCKLNISCIETDKPTISGCSPHLNSAKRLDDFVEFVKEEFGGFAYFDMRSVPPKLYKNVHFDKVSDPSSSHGWKTSQRRSYDLIWFPCCDGSDNHSGSCVINDYLK